MANCIRFLSVDAIEKAQSGHPGMVLGLADVTTVLFREFLRHSPEHPDWPNRDRVVFSNGHGSMLLYSALYLSGYDWDMEDLQRFRQLNSPAAGHPEYDLKRGVEVTTGPLGQGLANAVGMAVARHRLAALYGEESFNYWTYCFVGDGCLMEGISHEVSALAPKLISEGLIVLWDDNGISIDGQVDPWFENDVLQRYEAYGFEVIKNIDGHCADSVRKALTLAKQSTKPCFIQLKTVIGKGAVSIEGTAKAHGQPLGQQAVTDMRRDLQWKSEPFEIPEDLRSLWNQSKKGRALYQQWDAPKEISQNFDLSQWDEVEFSTPMATRQASMKVIEKLATQMPLLLGGSADLGASNLTAMPGVTWLNDHHFDQPYIAYGVREFGMFAIANGLSLSGLIPYVGTFLTFMDYGRNALRMAALMRLRVIYILTHDSIGLGEDGPTHQPIEHLLMCRATPNVELWRPCHLLETIVAWEEALGRDDGPTVLALSRQKLPSVPIVDREQIRQGAYILSASKQPRISLLATGSEVSLALLVQKELAGKGVESDVVSVPCLDRLEEMTDTDHILRVGKSYRFVIEAGVGLGWHRWVDAPQQLFTVEDFGLSAPISDIYNHFGLSVEEISQKILVFLQNRSKVVE